MKKKTKSWDELSKAEKRVALAKDVIAQLKKGKIIPIKGVFSKLKKVRQKYFKEEVELQSLLQENTCEVCGIGSLFVCEVLKRDDYKVRSTKEHIDRDDVHKRLEAFFTEEQLDVIETAFEKTIFNYSHCNAAYGPNTPVPTELGKRALTFGRKYKTNEQRLVAIMKNIIKNEGEFLP